MTLKRFFTFRNIVYLLATLYYLTIGIIAFLISAEDFNDRVPILAILIMVGSVPHLLVYLADRYKKSYLIIGLVGIAFGIVFLSTGDLFSDDQVCMIWGCIDICRGITEIVNVAPKVKENKGELIEIAVSTGDIVIGVLLCMHMTGGIRLHLTYLAIAFIICATKHIVELIIRRKLYVKGPDNH